MVEHLFTDVHDVENYFQQQFKQLEILREQELTSLECECEVAIQQAEYRYKLQLEQLKNQQELEQQTLHQSRKQVIIKIKKLF